MSEEEELPDELVKLEIAPALPLGELAQVPLTLNPFYDDAIDEPTSSSAPFTTQASKPQGQSTRNINCRKCRLRRRSESVLDDFKAMSSSLSTDGLADGLPPNTASANRSTPGVRLQPLKRGATSASKPLIREPVLRALQTCLHPNSSVRRKLLPAEMADGGAAATPGPLSHSQTGEPVAPLRGRGMSDFRDLINECQTLLEQDVDFSGRLNQQSFSRRRSKNFTDMQPLSATKSSGNAAGSGGPHLSSIMALRTASPSPSVEYATTSRSNTSCSQQAGNSSAACDDVTIDELASYFDTLVHIPKKMSSMAEMMYI